MRIYRSMRDLLLAFVLCTVLTLAYGCSSAGDVALSSGDSGREIEIERNQVIVVTLPSNPTTGYSWARTPGDDRVLVQEGESEFQQDAPNQQVVGAGGQEVLRFRAQDAGSTELQLIYRRPWEKDVEPEGVFSVQVTVR